jgi:hypothetical protein
MVLMMLSEYSCAFVTVFFLNILRLPAFADALSYFSTEFIAY